MPRAPRLCIVTISLRGMDGYVRFRFVSMHREMRVTDLPEMISAKELTEAIKKLISRRWDPNSVIKVYNPHTREEQTELIETTSPHRLYHKHSEVVWLVKRIPSWLDAHSALFKTLDFMSALVQLTGNEHALEGNNDGRSKHAMWLQRQKERHAEHRKTNIKGVPLDMRQRNADGTLSLRVQEGVFEREMRARGILPDLSLPALPGPEGWGPPAHSTADRALALLAGGTLTKTAALSLPAPEGWSPTAMSDDTLKKRRLPLAPIAPTGGKRFRR